MRELSLTLKQLRYLVALADARHFRVAAENCGIAQPSLSVQIQNLEEFLGARLVERQRAGVVMTPMGREVVARARRILLDVQGIVDVSSSSSRNLVGTIRLGVKPTLGPYLLPRVVATLHRQNPDLKLYIREGAPHELEKELARGTHDLILAQLPVVSTDLMVERLFREPVYLAFSSDHPLASRDRVGIEDLKDLPILYLTPDYHLHDQVHALCEEYGAKLVRDYEGTSLDALRQMVAMNIGATFLPALYAHSEIRRDSAVITKPLHNRQVFRSIGLVWRKGAGRSPAYRAIADAIRKTVSEEFPMLVREK